MSNRVDIDVFANDKTGSTFDDIEGKVGGIESGFESLTGISLTTAGVMAAIGGAVAGIVEFTKDAITETGTYNDQIKDLARITGDSLENTSRLIQVAQDLGIEYKDLISGLGNATKNGVDVSIDSLLTLADEYKDLETPIDRAKWLTENFGAAGRDLEPIFEQASQSIVEDLADVDEALVWDEEKQATVDEYERSLGELEQSFEDLKIEVSLKVMPAIQGLMNVMNDKEGWRGEGFKRMLGDVTTESWAATDALKELWSWLMKIAGGPSGGTVTSGAAIGIGSTAPTPYQSAQAWGGWESANTPHLVGERGPELWVPGTSGKVIPNNQLGGGGGVEIDYDRLTRSIIEGMVQSGYVR